MQILVYNLVWFLVNLACICDFTELILLYIVMYMFILMMHTSA